MKPELVKNQAEQWYVVVNPNAGNRKISRDWNGIKNLLSKSGLQYDVVFTKGIMDAVELTISAVMQGYRNFIVVGGDGTLNEVVHAFFLQKICPQADLCVGIIPVGTGNDWGRMFKIPVAYRKAIETLRNGKTFIQDIGRVSYTHNGVRAERHFLNIAGLGFDALVAKKTNQKKSSGRSNAFSYMISLITSLFEYHPSFVDLDIDGRKYTFNTFSMTVAICRYNGGGMMQSPNAIPDDGILDVTVIKKMGLGTILAQLKNLYNGRFIRHPKVFTGRGKNITIRTKKEDFQLETDGESLGSGPFEFSVIPKAMKVIIEDRNF